MSVNSENSEESRLLFCENVILAEKHQLKNHILYDNQFLDLGEISVVVTFWMGCTNWVCSDLDGSSGPFLIPQEYFDSQFVKLMLISDTLYRKTHLYFDKQKKKLFAVKFFFEQQDISQQQQQQKQQKNNQPETQNLRTDEREIRMSDQEIQGVLDVLTDKQNLQCDDQQQYDKRNIIRELRLLIKISKCSDERKRYIERFEGVVLLKQTSQQQGLQQKDRQQLQSQQQYTTLVIVSEFFGALNCKQKTLTCDIFHYFYKNYEEMYEKMYLQPKLMLIQGIFSQILEGLVYLHSHHIVIRDIKDDNIMIRKKYDSDHVGKSRYEILLTDLGFSKQFRCISNFNLQQSLDSSSNMINDANPSRRNSIEFDFQIPNLEKNSSIYLNYDIGPSIHPRFIYEQYPYGQRDDIYSLGILLIKFSHQHLFVTESQVSEQMKQLIEHLTGFDYKQIYEYFLQINKITQLKIEKEQLQEQAKSCNCNDEQQYQQSLASDSTQQSFKNCQKTVEKINQQIKMNQKELENINDWIRQKFPHSLVVERYNKIPQTSQLDRELLNNLSKQKGYCTIF